MSLNFTQSSKLIVSGKWYPTSYVNNETLLVTGVQMEDGALVRVGQLSNSNSGKFLSYTNTITYTSPEKSQEPGLSAQEIAGTSLPLPGEGIGETGNDTDGNGDEAGGNGDNEVIS